MEVGSEQIRIGEEAKIKAKQWPTSTDSENIKLKPGERIKFTFTVKINATNSDNIYKLNDPVEACAEIVNASYVDKKLAGDDSWIDNTKEESGVYYPQGKRPPAKLVNGSQIKSRDYFICKKYKVTIDKYITGVNRANGTNLELEEKVVDNNNYDLNSRGNKTSSEKKAWPVFVENGDIVTYTIRVDNQANETKPYFSPKAMKIVVEDTLPSQTDFQIMQITQQRSDQATAIADNGYTQTGGTITFSEFEIENNQSMYITLKVRVNNIEENVAEKQKIFASDTNAFYNTERKNTAVLQQIKNHYDKTVEADEIINNLASNEKNTDVEYFRIKEYNIVVDKYIANVNHVEEPTDQKIPTTYLSEGRITKIGNPASTTDNVGNVTFTNKGGTGGTTDQVSVEYGDQVTYEICVYNTTDYPTYEVNRAGAPYQAPQWVTVDLIDELPQKYSNLTVTNLSTGEILSNEVNEADKKLYLNDVKVEAGQYTIIQVKLVVEEFKKDTVETNTINLVKGSEYNINRCQIVNRGNRYKASDSYKLNDYNATLDEYISTYNAEMAIYNNHHGFTTGESEGFSNSTTSYPSNNPLYLEKYETLTFTTKVTNEASGNDLENSTTRYTKYNTRVRPTTVTQTLDYGLDKIGFKVEWHKADGTVETITDNIEIQESASDTDKKNTYVYTISKNAERIILSPNEYLLYITDVKVKESNLCLKDLESHSEITTLSNINRNIDTNTIKPTTVTENTNTRLVTTENLALNQNGTDKTKDSDFVKLKEVVIAGTVWIDEDKKEGPNKTDRNGYQDGKETGEMDVVVELYRITNETTGEAEKVKTVKTNENGFYTFDRQPRANSEGKYYQYYVEFEYDGIKYKATEIYGGDADGQADGMQNLGGKAGSATWRQGYEDLPDPDLSEERRGKTEYMTDSNAYEFDDVRNEFNQGNQTIGLDKTYQQTGEEIVSTGSLEYDKDEHVSILQENAQRVMTARSFITQDYTKKEGVNALGNNKNGLNDTNTLFLENYKEHHQEYPETEYLKFINLGLVTREETDVSIESDVYSVKTTINGEEMTYNFNKNDADSTAEDYASLPAGEKNAYKLNQAYNLNLYGADYNYRYDGYYQDDDGNYEGDELQNYKQEQSELSTEITYRIKIHNNDIPNDEPRLEDTNIPIETAINEMAIYYNENFVSANTVKGLLDARTEVKRKNQETGLLETYSEKSIRVNYGTKDELDKLTKYEIYRNDKAGISKEEYNNIQERTNIRGNISLKSGYGNTKPTDMKDYNVLYLTDNPTDNPEQKNHIMTDTYLKEGNTDEEARFIQITFTIDKDEARELKLAKEDMGFEVVSEISAYTTKYSENYKHKGLAGQYAGLVDRDSNPGNLNKNGIEDYENYEDDKYKVGITIQTFSQPDNPPSDNPPPNTRSIRGIVWEDARNEIIETEETGIQYIGNGKYVETDGKIEKAKGNQQYDEQYDKEKLVSGVKVTLMEVIQVVNENGETIYYEYPARYTYDFKDAKGNEHKKGDIIQAVTDEEGKYLLSDFIPGYYKVRFDYGYDATREDNILYNGQDYKSTKYYNKVDNQVLYYEKDYRGDNIGSENNFTYFNHVKSALDESKFSDAQDDEIRRLNVNSYSETMTTKQAKLFSELNKIKKDLEKEKKRAEELTKYTSMFAESAIFYVKPEAVNSEEKDIDVTIPEVEHVLMFGDTADFDKTRLWHISDLDFGLEYRPEASILLDNNLESVELVTSNNETLIKLYFTRDAKRKCKWY